MSTNQEWVQELMALGSRSTPTTVVEGPQGREVIIGFDRAKLEKAFGAG